MRFSVIIATYNCEQSIGLVLTCLRKQTFPHYDFEIICVDDHSTDRTVSVIQQFKGVKMVILPINRGNGPAKNVGVQCAKGDIHFFVDDHMYLASDALTRLDILFRHRPFISGICGNYKSKRKSDLNILRDIRRRMIYKKDRVGRFISVKSFYPFSITIGAIRKRLFINESFPETFGKNGAEDVLLQILHLHNKHVFYYSPEVTGIHDHNLNFSRIVRKINIEVYGMGELFVDLVRKRKRIPYQYGFLSYPLLLVVSILLTVISVRFYPILLIALLIEFKNIIPCFYDSHTKLSFRIGASLYILVGELVKAVYVIYCLSTLPIRRIPTAIYQLASWERTKLQSLFVS